MNSYKSLFLLILLTSGCAKFRAEQAANRGDIKVVESYVLTGQLTAEESSEVYERLEKKLAADCANFLGSALTNGDSGAMLLAGNCYKDCKSRQFCNKAKAIDLFTQAARRGQVGASYELKRLGQPVPPADLAQAYEEKKRYDAERQHQKALESQLEALTTELRKSNSAERECVSERVGSTIVERCRQAP